MFRRGMVDALVAAAFVCGYAAAANRLVRPVPYGYDEADYLKAASMGFYANWLDEPSIGIRDFVRTGTGSGRDPERKTQLSASVRASGDVLFYRHWHGPLYYYSLIGAAPLLAHDEQLMRRMTLVFPALTFLIAALILRTLPAGRPTALLFGVTYLASFSSQRVAAMVAPHCLFVLLSVAALACLAKLIDTRRLGWWYAAVAAAALALATLEIAIVLVGAMAVLCWLERQRTFAEWGAREWSRFAAQSAALFALVLTAVWPAGIWKLSLLKAWAFMGYLALFRKGAWGEVSFVDSWRERIAASPVEWLAICTALAVFVFSKRKPRTAVPALLAGGLMLAAVLRVVSTDPRYMMAYLPALLLFSAIALGGAAARLGTARSAVACAVLATALVWNSARQFAAPSEETSRQSWALIEFIRGQNLERARMLVPQSVLPVVQHYFPQATLRPYATPAEAAGLAAKGRYDGVLATDPFPRFGRP